MSWIAIEQVGIGIFSFQSQGLLIWDQFRLNSPFFLSSFHSVELFISFYIYISPVLIFGFFFTTVITFYVLVSFLSAFLYCRLLFRLRWLSMTDSLLAASPRHFNIFLCLLLWFFLSFSILLCGHRLFLPIFLWRRGWGGQGGRRGFPVRLAGVPPPPPLPPHPLHIEMGNADAGWFCRGDGAINQLDSVRLSVGIWINFFVLEMLVTFEGRGYMGRGKSFNEENSDFHHLW